MDSTAFYDKLADHYDSLFPVEESVINLTRSCLSGAPDRPHILDIGCATGGLCIKLAQEGAEVTGIDLDKKMVEIAKKKTPPKLTGKARFFDIDMMEAVHAFAKEKFDLVACLGNTLVHILDPEKMKEFLSGLKPIMNQNAKLLIQILNYDNVLDNGIKSLPLIENETTRFERRYTDAEAGPFLNFEVTLIEKTTRKKLNAMTRIYPLRTNKLTEMVREAGFKGVKIYGGFQRQELTEKSLPLVLTAST